LVVESASFDNEPEASIPNRVNFAELMTAHGFDAVIEVGTYYHYGEDKKEQKVVYYGKKVATGWDGSRVKASPQVPEFDSQSGRPIQ
jgi:hypothetical protein